MKGACLDYSRQMQAHVFPGDALDDTQFVL